MPHPKPHGDPVAAIGHQHKGIIPPNISWSWVEDSWCPLHHSHGVGWRFENSCPSVAIYITSAQLSDEENALVEVPICPDRMAHMLRCEICGMGDGGAMVRTLAVRVLIVETG